MVCQRLQLLCASKGLNISPSSSISPHIPKFPVFLLSLFRYCSFSPCNASTDIIVSSVLPRPLYMHDCIDISMPLLSGSCLLMSSVSPGGTKLSISVFLYVLGVCHPSLLLYCSLAITLTFSLCFSLLISSPECQQTFCFLSSRKKPENCCLCSQVVTPSSATLAVRSLSLLPQYCS